MKRYTRKPYIPPPSPEPIGPKPLLPPFRFRAPVTAHRPGDDLTWLRATLEEIEDRELKLTPESTATSEAGEKWRAEIQLLEDISYDGNELDLDHEQDRDTLTRRVDLLRLALNE